MTGPDPASGRDRRGAVMGWLDDVERRWGHMHGPIGQDIARLIAVARAAEAVAERPMWENVKALRVALGGGGDE